MMNNITKLETLLVSLNNYGLIGCKFIKEDYWIIEYNNTTIKGYTILAADNHYKRFEIDNWLDLEHSTIVDILLKNTFINKNE